MSALKNEYEYYPDGKPISYPYTESGEGNIYPNGVRVKVQIMFNTQEESLPAFYYQLSSNELTTEQLEELIDTHFGMIATLEDAIRERLQDEC